MNAADPRSCELCGAMPRKRQGTDDPVGLRLIDGEVVDVGICVVCEHAFRELAQALAARR